MHVWNGYAGRMIKACRFCEEPIKKGERIWYARNYSWKKWKADYYYHFDPQGDATRSCHDREGEVWYFKNPEPIVRQRGMTGRPKLDLTPEQRKKRKSLMVRSFQIRKDMLTIRSMEIPGWEQRMAEKNAHYNRIKEEMKKYGGAPTSWP